MDTRPPALVLLVEDHVDTREMDSFGLMSAGFAVMEAVDAADAIVTAADNRPDVVVTDMRLPGSVTAADLCRYFTPLGVPVLVVTGVGPGDEHDEVSLAGCAAIAMKPTTPDVLCAHLAEIVSADGSPGH